MFKNYELEKENESLKETIKQRDESLKELGKEKAEVEKEFQSKERILRAELQLEVNKAIEDEKANTQLVREENSVLKKEVAILNKAFENMGFDVKDMKEILNKLVDGLIAKNEIKLVNTKS